MKLDDISNVERGKIMQQSRHQVFEIGGKSLTWTERNPEL